MTSLLFEYMNADTHALTYWYDILVYMITLRPVLYINGLCEFIASVREVRVIETVKFDFPLYTRGSL